MALRAKSKGNRRSWLPLFAVIGFGFGVAFVLAKILLPGSKPPVGHSEMSGPLPLRTSTTRKVHIFFASHDGRHLQTEERRIEAEDAGSAIEAIIGALLEGPQDSKLASTIPGGTRLLHLFITDDGTAYVDFTQELSRLHPGGVASEQLTLYAIVNSIALNLDSVERVQLLLDGKPTPTLAGHMDTRHPRMANLLIVR